MLQRKVCKCDHLVMSEVFNQGNVRIKRQISKTEIIGCYSTFPLCLLDFLTLVLFLEQLENQD